MRIFVAGGTGYIGGAVLRALVAAGHEVTALVRDENKAAVVAALGARPHLGDLARAGGLADAYDVLIHAAALGADADAQAVRALAGPRLIYTSGTWIFGDITGAGEDTPVTRPAAIYQRRVPLEAEVLAAGGTVVRPGMVYGGRQGAAAWFDAWLPADAGRPGELVQIGDGQNRWSVVHEDELGELYRRIVERGASGVFHAVEAEPVAVRDLGAGLARASGKRLHTWDPAEAAAKIGAPLAQALTLDQAVIAPRAQALLGWQPRRALVDSVDSIWAEYSSSA